MVYHNISLTQYFALMNRPRFRAMVLISILSLAYCTTALAQARVVASIKPLQMIAGAITDGVRAPELLIPPHQSYHHFVLRPSTVRSLQRADLVIWVGPQLETYLSDRIAQSDPSSQQVLQVMGLPGLRVHSAQGGSDAPDSKAIVADHEGDHQHHNHGTIDPHVWLDTHNAGLIAAALTTELSRIDPAHASAYQANLERFSDALDTLRADVATRISMPADGRYAVYHNAFQYFEQEFGLQHALVFVESEELQPSVRHMLAIRGAIDAAPLLCLMEDVTVQPATVRTLLGKHDVLRVQADTTGRDLDSGTTSYLRLIGGVADAFRQCFGQW